MRCGGAGARRSPPRPCCLSCAAAGAGNDEDATVMLFSGRDLWRNGAFAYGGFLTAPGGFDDDGLMLKVLMSGGLYRYNAGDLGGARSHRRRMAWRRSCPAFASNVSASRPRSSSASMSSGTNCGPTIRATACKAPTSACDCRRILDRADAEDDGRRELSLSTIATSNAARLAYGWRVCEDMFEDGFYVGPEAQYFGSDGYRHLRLACTSPS